MGPQTDNQLWAEILKTLGMAVIYSITTGFTFYKGWIFYWDKQVKVSTDFIDTRVALLLKNEKEDMRKMNEELKNKITNLENNYNRLNEDSVRDMKEFMRNFK